MLYKLLSGTDRHRFSHAVISLLDEGTLGKKVQALGFPVWCMHLNARINSLRLLKRLKNIVELYGPDIIQGWMYHGNCAAQMIRLLSRRRAQVVWNIRGTHTSLRKERMMTAVFIWLGGQLSFLPSKIINNSRNSAVSHQQLLGYRKDKWVIIPNGFDSIAFAPSKEAREVIRAELALPSDTLLVGLIGRYHPMKDHANFLTAVSLLANEFSHVRYVMAGHGIDSSNGEIMELIKANDLSKHLFLLGERGDMQHLMPSLDISVSSSSCEGFSNVIGESMSCGVPCVVTDVGDSAWIVGDTGRVVPPGNPAALAQSLKGLIELGEGRRRALGEMARQRIIDNFSLDTIVNRYEQLYEDLYTSTARN